MNAHLRPENPNIWFNVLNFLKVFISYTVVSTIGHLARMRFFIFSGVLFFAFLFVFSIRGEDEADQKEEEDPYLYNEVDFQTSVESEPHFIMFFAPWCGHCKALKPAWKELSEYYNEEKTGVITIAKVDCTTDTKLCSDNGVTGYPTLKLFQPGKEAVRYKGARDLNSLKKYISETLQLEGEEAEEEEKSGIEVVEGLYELTTDTFDDHIATGRHFVKFFAPWCGHCMRMEPAWKELAAKFQDGSDVKISRVDCTQHQKVCGAKGVRGYPTLMWFKDGQEVEKYQGGRQLDNFVQYIEKMTTGGDDKPPPTEEEEKEVVEEKKPEEEEKPEGPEIVEGLYELDNDNFEPLTATGDFFIKFFAPWCGHCKRMEPAWKELAQSYENDDQVKIGRVDCTKNSAICKLHGVRGYPTLKYFRDGNEIEGSPGGRDIENLKKFVTRMSGKEEVVQQEAKEEEPAQQEEAEGGAMVLTDETFKDVTKEGITFVKFYAPWCGHCKRLAPTWDELADEDFGQVPKPVRIAKVDCTKHNAVCSDYEVRGYPTLKLFIDGEMKLKYQGARTLEALKNFVLENAVGSDGEDDGEQELQRDEL